MKYLILIISISLQLFAGQAVEKFNQANELYNNGEYKKAVNLYEQIIDNGYNDSKLFYNLANSYYKLEMIPNAILNYEKALKINTNDEDAKFNLRLANLKTIDKIEEVPKVFYIRWFNGIINYLGSNLLAWFSIAFIWLALLAFILFIKANNSVLKKLSFSTGTFFLIIFIFGTVLTYYSYNEEENKKEAIIFSESVYIKSSPDDEGTNLFMLHEGTKVQVLDEVDNWKKIKIKNGNIGWIQPGSIEII